MVIDRSKAEAYVQGLAKKYNTAYIACLLYTSISMGKPISRCAEARSGAISTAEAKASARQGMKHVPVYVRIPK